MGLDLRLLEAAALLHDIARGRPDHAARGAELLAAMGFPRVAAVVAGHIDLSAPAAADLGEEALLFLADKLVADTSLVALPERVAAVETRFAGDAAALTAARRRMQAGAAVARRVEEIVGAPLENVLAGLANSR
jgi:hypothetical protein